MAIRVKNANLEWYVLTRNWTTQKIEKTNVLGNILAEKIHKKVKKSEIKNLKDLKEMLDKDFMYHYWCKSEYEILVGGLHIRDIEETQKIDVYSQLMMNIDRIVEYINERMNLGLK